MKTVSVDLPDGSKEEVPLVALRVTMPDGSKWDVPIHLIAENYARHYGGDDSAAFKTEYQSVIQDQMRLKDWAENSMNWPDVSKDATRAVAPELTPDDFQDGWMNGKKEFVEL